MISRTTPAILVLLAAAGPTAAQTNGEAGAPVLQLTTVPRAAALGGALVAAEGLPGIFANPAAAATVERWAAHVAGQSLFEGGKAGTVAAGLRTRVAVVALGIQYLDLGSVAEVVCDGCGGAGTPTGRTVSASERAFSLAVAVRPRGPASVGIAVHHYGTTVADSTGNAVSVSAGARARAGSRLALGASVQYLGGDVELAGFSAPLPRTVRLGAELRPVVADGDGFALTLAAEYTGVRGSPGRVGGGVELGLVRLAAQFAGLLRLGAATTAGGDFATNALSVGAGLRYGQITFDYAFQGSDLLAAQHRVGITIAP